MKSLGIGAVLLFTAFAANANADLAKTKNCLSCHSINNKIVGPAFKDISSKYAGVQAEQMLVKKIMNGGSGAWGSVKMPPNTQVTEAEAKTLVSWILSLR